MIYRFVIVVLLTFACSVVFALETRKSNDVKKIAQPEEAVQRAINRINKRYQGRVLSARPVKVKQGPPRVRVKFLSKDGVIKILFVDPNED